MNHTAQKIIMWSFGTLAIAGLALFLTFYRGSPGPLSAPHAAVAGGSFIQSCSRCHTDEGLTAGCLSCHSEIDLQLKENRGYHAHLLAGSDPSCEKCHSEHHGAEFPLVSALSWQDTTTNTFNHPHVEFKLTGKHETLACEKCHKPEQHFSLPDFPDHPRAATFLGLSQDCTGCHENIHKTPKMNTCTQCHDQHAFVPAPHFNHNGFFVLEGAHAKAACTACHATDTPVARGQFGAVKGKSCIDCHQSPHRSPAIGNDCQSCHRADDPKWNAGERGVTPELHARFGFTLEKPHADAACIKCHAKDRQYTDRYPEPTRKQSDCAACHTDPHVGEFQQLYDTCQECHFTDRFKPARFSPDRHIETFPLSGAHEAVACIQCHKIDESAQRRRFCTTEKACKTCHENPHGDQFQAILSRSDCTYCHRTQTDTFQVRPFDHNTKTAYPLLGAHAKAECNACHAKQQGIRIYRNTPTDCAACHQDIHRGQFARAGETRCTRCHDSTARWTTRNFEHDRDSAFALKGAHSKTECKACHLPVQQPDGQAVVQYRPLTTRCEDCHGFSKK